MRAYWAHYGSREGIYIDQ